MGRKILNKPVENDIVRAAQYLLTFAVVAVMLKLVGIPFFVIFFLGILSYFIWKMVSPGSRAETRGIFAFYLTANEILRDNSRSWFGFEIQETIAKGENILRSMTVAPPLLNFTLGALYHRAGDYASAATRLRLVYDESAVDEIAIVFPTPELRDYVKLLRKIESEPAEAPLTSSAVRSLERMRRSKGLKILQESNDAAERISLEADTAPPTISANFEKPESITEFTSDPKIERDIDQKNDKGSVLTGKWRNERSPGSELLSSQRKPITEVLQDIYDTKSN